MPQLTCVPTIYSITVNATDPEKFEALHAIIQAVRIKIIARKDRDLPPRRVVRIELSSRGNVELFLEVFTDLY